MRRSEADGRPAGLAAGSAFSLVASSPSAAFLSHMWMIYSVPLSASQSTMHAMECLAVLQVHLSWKGVRAMLGSAGTGFMGSASTAWVTLLLG